jgi:hypothetical protein
MQSATTLVQAAVTSFTVTAAANITTAFNVSVVVPTTVHIPVCPNRNRRTYDPYSTTFKIECGTTHTREILAIGWTESLEPCMNHCDSIPECVDVSFYPFGVPLRTYPGKYHFELQSTLGPPISSKSQKSCPRRQVNLQFQRHRSLYPPWSQTSERYLLSLPGLQRRSVSLSSSTRLHSGCNYNLGSTTHTIQCSLTW